MKQINLLSLVNAYNSLEAELFKQYLKSYGIKLKDNDEALHFKYFVEEFQRSKDVKVDIFNGFNGYFVGYTIPQISKEFDLLRIGNIIVNIEIKRDSTEEKILKQLIRNKCYLSFLGKKVYNFTYVSNEKKLYQLNNDALEETNFEILVSILNSQKIEEIKDINSLFKPSNYLVSPFNSTQEFIDGKYFLTSPQEEIKAKAIEEIEKTGYSFIGIKGGAGTGKTLLTYDIAKEIIKQGKKVLIVHCGYLNKGHDILNNNHSWNIIPINKIKNQNISEYDLIIIDEVQRIYSHQLDKIINQIKQHSKNCIFSFDQKQILRQGEGLKSIENIEQVLTIDIPELSKKIRTNKELAHFIRCLFNNQKKIEKFDYSNVEINYFDNEKIATSFIKQKILEGWKYINYTPSIVSMPYNKYSIEEEEDTAHKVIGQEFDNIITIIDKHFFYNDNGGLAIKGYKPYYEPSKMLYQIVSRVRNKLCIVIVDNPIILQRCLDIIS